VNWKWVFICSVAVWC